MLIKDQLKLQKDIQVPYPVWTAFGDCAKVITIAGNQASLTNEADYKTIEELQIAIEFYVNQLGGKVKWEKK